MIPVIPQPEPTNFNIDVRNPGNNFLSKKPKPKSDDWQKAQFWTKALKPLWTAYQGVCAYSCHWIPFDVGSSSIDHFVPKSIAPQLAYEWKNYRLATKKLNSRKSNSQDVLDPFTLKPDSFTLLFPAMLTKPNPKESAARKIQIQATIDRLQLNADETIVTARLQWVLDYCSGEISFEFLKRKAPFIAHELERQGLKNQIATIMKPRQSSVDI